MPTWDIEKTRKWESEHREQRRLYKRKKYLEKKEKEDRARGRLLDKSGKGIHDKR